MLESEGKGSSTTKMLAYERGLREDWEERETRLREDIAGLRRACDEAQRDIVRLTQVRMRVRVHVSVHVHVRMFLHAQMCFPGQQCESFAKGFC